MNSTNEFVQGYIMNKISHDFQLLPFEEVQCAGGIADESYPAVRHEDDLLEHGEEFASGLVDGADHCLSTQCHRL